MSLAQQDTVANGLDVDREAVLRTLNLNPRDPNVQALVLVCQQYGLDPVLKHAVLIKGNLYVTRDGLLHVAHQSGRLDGIVVEDEGETGSEWWAKVAVYVKGQTHPYTYKGRYPKDGNQKRYGPEMAVKCAEVMALRRAFGVTGIATVEEQWDKHDDAIDAELVDTPAVAAGPEADPNEVPSFIDPPDNPDAKHAGNPLPGWLKGLHAAMGETFGKLPSRQMDAYRRRLVIAVSGEGKSSRDLSDEERTEFLVLLGRFAEDELHFAAEGDDWVIVEGPAPAVESWADVEAQKLAEDSSAGGFPDGWSDLAGPAKTKALKAARQIAAGDPPSSFDAIGVELAQQVMAAT